MNGLLLFISDKEITFNDIINQIKIFDYGYEEKQVFQPLDKKAIENQRKQYEHGEIHVITENGSPIKTAWKELYPTFEDFLRGRFDYDEEDKVFGITCNPDWKFTTAIAGGRWAPFPLKKPKCVTDLVTTYQSPKHDIDIELMLNLINSYDSNKNPKAYEEAVQEYIKRSGHNCFFMPDAIVKNGKWIDLPEDDRSWEKVFSMINDEEYISIIDYVY